MQQQNDKRRHWMYHSAIRFNYLVRLNWFIISSLYNFTFFQKLAQEFRMLQTISLTIIFHPLYFAFTFQYYIQFPHTYSLLFSFFIFLFICFFAVVVFHLLWIFAVHNQWCSSLYLTIFPAVHNLFGPWLQMFRVAPSLASIRLQMIGNGVSFWYVFFKNNLLMKMNLWATGLFHPAISNKQSGQKSACPYGHYIVLAAVWSCGNRIGAGGTETGAE